MQTPLPENGLRMQTVEQALVQFHRTYGLVINDTPLRHPAQELRKLRMSLHAEEYTELKKAMMNHSLIGIADGICDLVYVAVGTAVSYGIPFDRCFAEVQRSNMSKLGEDGLPIVREDGKILKGPNFTPPDLESIIYGRI